jgi:hypothetical protein
MTMTTEKTAPTITRTIIEEDYGSFLEPRDLDKITERLEELIDVLVPENEHGVVLLSGRQRYAVQCFLDWLDERYG